MNERPYLDLKERIEARLDIPAVRTVGDEMSVATLINLLSNRFGIYNDILVKDSYVLTKIMNKKTSLTRFFRGDIPYISKIVSLVDDNGNCSLQVVFTDEHYREVGRATINSNCAISLDLIKPDYNNNKIMELLQNYTYKFFQYLSVLNEFTSEFPNTRCEWNNNYEMMDEKVVDDFITSHLHLDKLDDSCITFTKLIDQNNSREWTNRYGELYDYAEAFKYRFFNRQRVNINDLNPLYKRILEKDKQLEVGPIMKKVR